MPYYEERYKVDDTQQSLAGVGPFLRKDTYVKTWRSQARTSASSVRVIPDSEADPVTNYLSYINEQQYIRNLADRGLSQKNPLPDRGHTFELRSTLTEGGTIGGYMAQQQYPWDGLVASDIRNLFPAVSVDGRHIGTPPPAVGTAELEAFAQRSFSRAAPKSAKFNVTRFVGELREGIPSFTSHTYKALAGPTSALDLVGITKLASGIGKDTLNSIFGWTPLIGDVTKFVSAMVDITTGLMSTDSFDRPQHRSYKEPQTIRSVDSVFGSFRKLNIITAGSFGNTYGGTQTFAGFDGHYRTSSRTEQRRWFEGAFTRFLPSGYDGSRFLDRASLLLNTDLTPLTLWQLSPWSWLVDWYVDVSTFLSAHEVGVDNLLFAHYAYAMEETVTRDYLDWDIKPDPSYARATWTGPTRGGVVITTTTKRRIRASPFGFQVGRLSPLSGYQSTVLGALALTKTRR